MSIKGIFIHTVLLLGISLLSCSDIRNKHQRMFFSPLTALYVFLPNIQTCGGLLFLCVFLFSRLSNARHNPRRKTRVNQPITNALMVQTHNKKKEKRKGNRFFFQVLIGVAGTPVLIYGHSGDRVSWCWKKRSPILIVAREIFTARASKKM